MIFTYHQWIKESEKVEAPAFSPAEGTDAASMGTEEADKTPAEMSAPPEVEPEEKEPTSSDVEKIDDTSEIGKFRKLDQARREAVKAFKTKQKEFLEMPDEMRKTPQSDEDKQKVESIKTELIELSKKMKAAETEFNKFNDSVLGLTPDVEGDDSMED